MWGSQLTIRLAPVSWAYILGDVSYEGYKAYLHSERTRNPALELTPRQRKALGIDESDASSATAASVAVAATADGNPKALTHGVVPPLEDYRTVIAQRAIFQSIASMGLPAFTIHSVVKYSGRAMKDVKNVRLRTWVPIGLGLSVVPFLPSLFDKPVENAVEWLFHKGFETVGGKEYVGHAKTTGREMEMSRKPHERKEKEE